MAGNRRWKRLIGLLFVLLIWGASAVLAAVPAEINYQGSIEDLSGPVDGTLTMTFRLFDADVAGTIVWEEAQSVLVNQGIYNVILGTGTLNPSYGSLEEAVFENDDLWLEIQVAGEADAMAPRQKITSVGFAMRAGSVSDGTITATMLANEAVTTEKLVDGAVTAAKVTGGFVPNLDADLLDGLSSTAFASAAHTHDTRYYTQAQVEAMVSGLQGEIDALKALLQGVTRAGNHITFSGVNVQIVNGSGQTGVMTGTGNLIVGYNELRGSGDDRSGSHNIVVGRNHNYSYYGGLVVGYYNSLSGAFASVSGGRGNTASGSYASVSGGQGNTASGSYASVSGGSQNTASGAAASVSGGHSNSASEWYSSVSGGLSNTASVGAASVSGGQGNTASGYGASVSGGRYNTASGDYTFVGGGGGATETDGNQAFANYSAILGGFKNVAGDSALSDHAIGDKSTVSGGESNKASGRAANVSGGRYNTASGDFAFAGGGGGELATDGNQAFGNYTSVLGGKRNIAGDPDLTDHDIGTGASVSAGDLNKASGNYANVSGGLANTARGYVSSIGGGYSNEATNDYSGVSGGANNTASGRFASVSGGQFNEASGSFSAVAGGGGGNSAYGNKAFGDLSAVLGGRSNLAGDFSFWDHSIGSCATVSGGIFNTASGYYSSVSGGESNTAVNDFDSVVGDTGAVFVDSTPVH